MEASVEDRSQEQGDTARLAQWLRNALHAYYHGGTLNLLIELLAVFLGFSIVTAWQVRDRDLQEARRLNAVLDPLTKEVSTLLGQVQYLQAVTPCQMTGFHTAYWHSTPAGELRLVLGPLYPAVEKIYTDQEATSAQAPGFISPRECQLQLADLRKQLEELETTLRRENHKVVGRLEFLTQSETSGLGALVWRMIFGTAGILLVIAAALLILPGAILLGALLVLNRLSRSAS